MTGKPIMGRAERKGRPAGRPCSRRSTLKGSLALAAGFGIIGRASAAPVNMRFGSDSPIGSAHSKSAVVLKELVESRTAGRVEVTIFPDGQLGGNGPMTNSIKAGTLDAVVTDMAHISVAVPQADVFNLPFLFKDTAQVLRFANGPVGGRLKPRMNEAFGCEVLGFATDGARNLWNGKHPIRTPADIAGLKMGLGSSKIQRDTILAFGGIPTVVEINALYTALQTGLVDGTDRTTSDAIALKLYQVTRYLTLSNHFSIVSVLIVSNKLMEKLGPRDQAIVREAGQPAVDAQVEDVLRGEKTAVAFLQEKGIQVLPLDNSAAFSDRLEGVYKEAAGRIGADLVEQARTFS
jgi:tripartite ATP-independent transporter DctP family solute receptor